MNKQIRLRSEEKLYSEIEQFARCICLLLENDMEVPASTLQWRNRANIYEYYARFGLGRLSSIAHVLDVSDCTLVDLPWFPAALSLWKEVAS